MPRREPQAPIPFPISILPLHFRFPPAPPYAYNPSMAIILSLLIFCLGLYFLSLFFQVARLEKTMTEGVTLLETYMIAKYALDKNGKKTDDAEAAAAEKSATPG